MPPVPVAPRLQVMLIMAESVSRHSSTRRLRQSHTVLHSVVGSRRRAEDPDAGRSLSLLDPTYASKYIPIIASVSEHQPPAWPSYFTDLNILVNLLLAPTRAHSLP